MARCTCSNEMEYEDNSILSDNKDTEGIYYCRKCNKLYDGMLLDCDSEYIEIKRNKSKYLRWFSAGYKTKKQLLLNQIAVFR